MIDIVHNDYAGTDQDGYLFSDDDYEFTEIGGNGCVIFTSDGEITYMPIKDSAIEEIKSQPYFG